MTMIMTAKLKGSDLDLADDRIYADYIVKRGFREGEVWMLLLDPVRIDRTLELLQSTKANIELQLGHANRTQKGGAPEWRKRTLNLLRIVNTYLVDIKAEVKRLDAEEREESAEGERDAWKHIAGLLVDLFHDNPALALITLPYGDITAADWAKIRSEKAAAKVGGELVLG